MFRRSYANLSILALTTSSLFSFSSNADDYIVPPMVNIPAGEFFMGSNDFDKGYAPMHSVALNAFQMGKYPVTVAEFRKFVEGSGFEMNQTCSDHLDENWLAGPDEDGEAAWDRHRYLESEYMPVTCITWEEAHAYIDWLKQQTGKPYRLPTEQEWEYATKANTTSRYFWGDDQDMSQACEYGNFADHAGEYFASRQYGASYIGFLGHANCNDGEPYNAIVGLYRPNPFGLYDMVGNVSQMLASCYYEGYEARPEQDMNLASCKRVSHRGSTWHYPPVSHFSRGRIDKTSYGAGALMGFRLALDDHSDEIASSTQSFEQKLQQAQAQRLATRPKIPMTPKHVQLKTLSGGKALLSWQPVESSDITGYEIYQSNTPYGHMIGQYFKRSYHKIHTLDKNQSAIELAAPEKNISFKVVATTKDLTSMPSEPVYFAQHKTQSIPGQLDLQHATKLENVYLAHRKAGEDRPELFYLSRVNKGFEQPLVAATFDVNVKKTGWYWVNYRGRSFQNGPFFKLWKDNTLLADIDFDPDFDDKTSKRHKVYLEKGQQTLEMNLKIRGFDYWNFVWLAFSEVQENAR